MENLAVFLITILSYIAVIVMLIVTITKAVRMLVEKRKIKNTIQLTEKGYKILTSDSKGIPMLLIKGSSVVTSWKGEKL